MEHTLKTLYEWSYKHNKKLVDKFKDLKNYCINEDKINKQLKQKDLKWLIYTIRKEVSQETLQFVFYICLLEAFYLGEKFLYNDVTKFYTTFNYLKLLNKKEI